MAFLRRKSFIRNIKIVYILQFLLGIAIALYPRVIDGTINNKSHFYIIAVFVIILAVLQFIEKSINTNRNKKNITGESFLEEYAETLANAFRLAPEVHKMNEEEIAKSRKLILEFIRDFVRSYFEDTINLEVSANLMLRKEISDYQDFKKDVHFVDDTRAPETYECVLAITQSSNTVGQIPDNFAIPVDKDLHRILPGAPKAFHYRETSIINDITDSNSIESLLQGQPKVVSNQILDFFSQMKYKSFVSIPLITSKGKAVGVVNIQTNQPYVFGKEGQDIKVIEKYLNPFLVILTALKK